MKKSKTKAKTFEVSIESQGPGTGRIDVYHVTVTGEEAEDAKRAWYDGWEGGAGASHLVFPNSKTAKSKLVDSFGDGLNARYDSVGTCGFKELKPKVKK